MAKRETRNDKKLAGDQIILSCLLGKELEVRGVNVTLGSATLTSFSYQFTCWCVCMKYSSTRFRHSRKYFIWHVQFTFRSDFALDKLY